MPEYRFTARDIRGERHKGTLAAPSPEALVEQARAGGLFVLSWQAISTQDIGQRMSSRDLSAFCRELGTMLQSGVPLLRAVEIMLRRDLTAKRRACLADIHRLLCNGVALSDALERQGRVFPPLLISMFRAAEASGTAGNTALSLAEHYDKEHRLGSKIRSATTYPVLLLGLTVVIVTAIFTLILPRFIGLYGDRELPPITRVVLAASRLFTGHYMALLLAAVVVLLGILLLRQWGAARVWMDRLKLSLPVLGGLFRIIATARFARTLSALYASGLSILTALEVARGTVGNHFIAAQFGRLISDVESGAALSEALEGVRGFDQKLSATVAVGEQSGKLEAMLLAVSDAFDHEAAESAARLVSILEPFCIIVMAAIIGTIMVAVLLPILGMYDSLGSIGTGL